VCGPTFSKRILDGENVRVFEDTYHQDDPNVINNERESHAAIDYSDRGTVCFHHLSYDGGCLNCCDVTCLGIGDPSTTHTLTYRDGDGDRWFMEMRFSKAGTGTKSAGKENLKSKSALAAVALTVVAFTITLLR